MSNLMEERLRDALAARADQVTPEDLGPLVVPAAAGRSRRTAVLAGLAAAAVVAAVVGVPLLGQDPGAPAPGPAEPSPSPTPSVVEQGRAEVRTDLDGDGERRPRLDRGAASCASRSAAAHPSRCPSWPARASSRP